MLFLLLKNKFKKFRLCVRINILIKVLSSILLIKKTKMSIFADVLLVMADYYFILCMLFSSSISGRQGELPKIEKMVL